MHGPDPMTPHPMAGFPRVGFLRPLVKNPNVVVGEYTDSDDPDGPEHFEAKCVLYHFPSVGDRLVIGRFCALALDVYQRLKFRVVGRLPAGGWALTEHELADAIRSLAETDGT